MPAAKPRSRRRVVSAAAAVLLVVSAVFAVPWLMSWRETERARSALSRGDLTSALSATKRADTWKPGRAETAYLQARAERRSGDLAACAKSLQIAAERGWPPQQLRDQHFLAQIQSGRVDEADEWLQQTLSSRVSDELAEEVYEAQAKGFLKSYRLSDAVVCLTYWINWKPQAIQPRLWLADVWERCDRWQAAAAEYAAVVKLAPEHFEARRKLAENLLNVNDVDGAERNFGICARLRPDDASVQLGLARCLRRQGALDEAESLLQNQLRSAATGPYHVGELVELAQIRLDRREVDQALELLKEAVHLDPNDAPAHNSLATAFQKAGRLEESEAHRVRSDEILKRFNRLTEITSLLADSPGDADLRFEAGKILMEQGRRAEGADWMATALLVDPRHVPTHQSLAEYFESIGDARRAEEHRALTLDHASPPSNE